MRPIARARSLRFKQPITDGADSESINKAYTEFVRVHQVALNILIAKCPRANLFNIVPFIVQPVAAVLRKVEDAIDISDRLRTGMTSNSTN
ncbi:hypothetical protein HBH94_024940 [Parastagonospora nodorum]|nr:hypothetical protein HBH94_024940 [Parastagonospora nodorum]